MSEALPPPLPVRAKGHPAIFGFTPYAFPASVRKCAEKRDWQGPAYLLTSHWQSDLLAVMEQIRLCVRSNVPLSTGFEAIAHESLATYKEWSPQKSTRMFKFFGILFLILSAALGTVAKAQGEGPAGLIGLLGVGGLIAWCYLDVFYRYRKPMAIFLALKRHLDAGNPLSEAMARLPRFFPRNLVRLVAAGEATGNLPEILERFGRETITSIGMQQQSDRTLRYLACNFLLVVPVAILIGKMLMPALSQVTSELGVTPSATVPGVILPIPTLHSINATFAFLADKPYLPLAFLILVSVALWRWWHRRRRNWSGRAGAGPMLAIPGFRGLIVADNLGSAARTMHHLLKAGVPLHACLDMVSRGDLHPWYRQWFGQLRDDIAQGMSLSEACDKRSNRALVPPSFRALLSLGEAQGDLLDSLEWIGIQYHERYERRSRFLVGCVLPAGIFALGYLVLTVEASAFHAIASIAETLSM